MGLFSKMKKIGKKAGKLTSKAVKKVGGKKLVKFAKKSGILKKALRMVPVVGTAYGAYELASAAKGLLPGSSGKGGLPALPGMAAAPPMGNTGGTGIMPKGPGGSWQLPWNDPRTPALLQQFALDDEYLKTYYRAPKGYVIVKDASGRPYPLLKWAAVKFGMWKPNKKPPISVGEHQAIKRADRAVRKIKKTLTMVSRVDRNVSKGGKVVCKKRK